MQLGATQALWVGIALAAIIALGGRYSAHYLKRQAPKAERVSTEFDECVKRFYAAHPVPKDAGMTFDEAIGKTDATGAPIPCQFDMAAAAAVSAEHDQQYSARSEHWSPRAAIAVLLLFGAPWFWQFLLRRVTELGAAFRGGKPPPPKAPSWHILFFSQIPLDSFWILRRLPPAARMGLGDAELLQGFGSFGSRSVRLPMFAAFLIPIEFDADCLLAHLVD